jgi:hypothetical protein
MNLDLDKIAKKRQYKLRGIFLKYEAINSYFGKVFISKGTGTKKKIFVFTAKGHLTNQFINLLPKYRIKVWFNISCREYKSNWFTELNIESFEHWAVNEDKIKKEAQQLDLLNNNLYSKSLFKQDFNDNFTEK